MIKMNMPDGIQKRDVRPRYLSKPWTTELRNSPQFDLEFTDSSDTIAVYSWQQQCQNYCL